MDRMAHNTGKGSNPSNNNACGSKLCRYFVFVLLVLVVYVYFLVYSCIKEMSRNEILMDRVRSYEQQVSELKFERKNQARSLEEAKSQILVQQNTMRQGETELVNYIQKANHYLKAIDEQKRKMEALSVELSSKEQMFAKQEQILKQLTSELETKSSKLQESERRVNSLKQLVDSCTQECDKRAQAEAGRIVNIIRKLHGPDPVKELVKAGDFTDISEALNTDGSPQSQEEKRKEQTSGRDLPKQDQEQAKPVTEQPKLGQDHPQQHQEVQNKEVQQSGQETPKPDQEQPKQGEQRSNSSQEQPKPGQEQPKQGQEQSKQGQKQQKQGQEQPKSDQEQPQSGEKPKAGQEPLKPGQEQPKPVDKKLKPGENLTKSGGKKEEAGKARDDDQYYDDNETTKKPQDKQADQGQLKGQLGQEPGQPKGQPAQEPGKLKFETGQKQDKGERAIRSLIRIPMMNTKMKQNEP